MNILLKMTPWVTKLYDKRIITEPNFVVLNNVSDCKAANHFPEGRVFVKLLLSKMDLYDELGPKNFANGFNHLIRTFYSGRYDFCPDNYACLKIKARTIRFLHSTKRDKILDALVPKPDVKKNLGADDKTLMNKLVDHLKMSASVNPFGNNSVRQSASYLGIPYKKALNLVKEVGYTKNRIKLSRAAAGILHNSIHLAQ